jgi:predicted transcriptional regulator
MDLYKLLPNLIHSTKKLIIYKLTVNDEIVGTFAAAKGYN